MSPAAMVQRAWRGSDGREYVTNLDGGTLTPAPWINVISDSAFFQVLDETVPFLEGHILRESEDEAFFPPTRSADRATLFEHCALALDQSFGIGAHGLPLIGTGDWNDGMNSIGEKGRGESIWLGWLLHAALTTFAPDAPEARAAS